MSRRRERQVEDQDGACFNIGHPGGRLAEVDRSLALDQAVALVVHEADPDAVGADLGAAAADPEHQVGARVNARELRHPDVLKQAKDGQLALLIDQGVVGEDREVEQQAQLTRIEVISSFFRIAFTTSMPEVTWPNTVCTPSRCDWGA